MKNNNSTINFQDGEKLLSVEDASQLYACTESNIRALVRKRRIPFIKVGKLVRFRLADLEAYCVRIPTRIERMVESNYEER
jgi:excisionase family DNA binding protein